MSKPKLIYFDAPVSRGEECRIALHAAGIDFEDVRIKREDWPALKPSTPFGGLPVFEVEGHPPLAQSNAILVLIGRQHGLHPKDNFEAARHEAMMAYAEDLRGHVAPTMRINDEEEKKKAREALCASYLPTWGENVEKQIRNAPFFGGPDLCVVDIKLFIVYRWLASGKLDYIPATVFSAFPKLTALAEAVRNDPRVQAWHARG